MHFVSAADYDCCCWLWVDPSYTVFRNQCSYTKENHIYISTKPCKMVYSLYLTVHSLRNKRRSKKHTNYGTQCSLLACHYVEIQTGSEKVRRGVLQGQIRGGQRKTEFRKLYIRLLTEWTSQVVCKKPKSPSTSAKCVLLTLISIRMKD